LDLWRARARLLLLTLFSCAGGLDHSPSDTFSMAPPSFSDSGSPRQTVPKDLSPDPDDAGIPDAPFPPGSVVLDPPAVDFGTPPFLVLQSVNVILCNGRREDIEIRSVRIVEDDDRPEFEDRSGIYSSGVLHGGDARTFTVAYTSRDDEEDSGRLGVEIGRAGGTETLEILLTAHVTGIPRTTCVTDTGGTCETGLQFGDTAVREGALHYALVENAGTGNRPLRLNEVEVRAPSDFSVSPESAAGPVLLDADFPFFIGPGGPGVRIQVDYAPSRVIEDVRGIVTALIGEEGIDIPLWGSAICSGDCHGIACDCCCDFSSDPPACTDGTSGITCDPE